MKIIEDTPVWKFKDLSPGTPFYYQKHLFMKMFDDLNYNPYNAIGLEDGRCVFAGKDTLVQIAKVHIEQDKE